MRLIGLTGGIATGKSTVGRFLVELGAELVDADRIAHEVILKGRPAHAVVVEAFGRTVLDAKGEIDRAVLGRIVFNDEDKRRRLNRITHSRIAERIAIEIQQRHDRPGTLVIEAALLVETGSADWARPLIVVTAEPEIQLERLMKRDGLDETAARDRIRSQMPVSEKAKVADHVIDNSGSLESTYRQTCEVWRRIHDGADV